MRGIRACVFDAYGTLFDFAAAARTCGDDLGSIIGAGARVGATSSPFS